LWEWPVTLGLGGFIDVHSLHFWINDGLMTVFFRRRSGGSVQETMPVR
jgi:Na+/H+ antiporter NhaA